MTEEKAREIAEGIVNLYRYQGHGDDWLVQKIKMAILHREEEQKEKVAGFISEPWRSGV